MYSIKYFSTVMKKHYGTFSNYNNRIQKQFWMTKIGLAWSLGLNKDIFSKKQTSPVSTTLSLSLLTVLSLSPSAMTQTDTFRSQRLRTWTGRFGVSQSSTFSQTRLKHMSVTESMGVNGESLSSCSWAGREGV